MPAVDQKIIVVDDQEAYFEPIRDVFTDIKYLSHEKLAFEFQSNGQAAVERIIALSEQGEKPIVSFDLHMGGTELNGDTAIARLAELGLDIPYIVVTGTIAEKRLRDIATTLGGALPIFNKSHFDPRVIASGKGLGDERIKERFEEALRKSSTNKLTSEQIALLREVAAQDHNIPEIFLFVDWLKAKSMQINQSFCRLFEECKIELPSTKDFYSGGQLEISEKIHAYKNELSLLMSRLELREEAEIFSELLAVLEDFRLELITKIRQRSEKSHSVDLVEVVNQLVDKHNQGYPCERIFSDIKAQDLKVDCDAGQLKLVLNELICNALTHNDKNSCAMVRVEWQDHKLFIYNYLVPGQSLTFTIFENQIHGELPTVSASKSGTAQGLKHILQICEELGISLSIDSLWDDVTTTLDFGAKYIQPKAINSALNKIAPEHRKNVVFMCHDGIPEISFSEASNMLPEGFTFELLKPNRYLLSYENYQENPELFEEFDLFVKENFEIFNSSCLCVIHMSELDYPILDQIQKYHPHLQFLPVSEYGTSYYIWEKDRVPGVFEKLPQGRFTLEKLDSYLQESDEVSSNELRERMFYKRPNSKVFQTIVRIASRVVEDRF